VKCVRVSGGKKGRQAARKIERKRSKGSNLKFCEQAGKFGLLC